MMLALRKWDNNGNAFALKPVLLNLLTTGELFDLGQKPLQKS